MTSSGWDTIGFAVVIGLPLIVCLGAICWPERIPKDRSVEAIRKRIEDEDSDPLDAP